MGGFSIGAPVPGAVYLRCREMSLCCKSLQRGSNLDLLLINSMNWMEGASFVKANVDEEGKASGFAHE